MKSWQAPALITLLAIAAAGAAFFMRGQNDSAHPGAPSHSSNATEQVFTVRGRVLSLDEDSGIVKIAHEEIPNYMPAMTMPFMTRDSNGLRSLKIGDTVRFKLAVTSDDSWISEIEKETGAPPVPLQDSNSEADSASLKPGEKVPDFSFVDENANPRSLEDFKGKFVVLTFIYTRCPLPNFCPLLGKKFAELQDRLSKEFPGKFHLLSVTIDPSYDTAEVLKGYSSLLKADPAKWTYATGSAEQIATIGELFGLSYSEKTPGLIEHDMRTALIAPDGRLIHIWKSNFWTPYEVRNRIDESMSRQSAAQDAQ